MHNIAKFGKNRQSGRSTGLLNRVGQSLSRMFSLERYRPEQHYMRGPGPKTRAKHGSHGGQATIAE